MTKKIFFLTIVVVAVFIAACNSGRSGKHEKEDRPKPTIMTMTTVKVFTSTQRLPGRSPLLPLSCKIDTINDFPNQHN